MSELTDLERAVLGVPSIHVPVVPITVKHLPGQHDQADHGAGGGEGRRSNAHINNPELAQTIADARVARRELVTNHGVITSDWADKLLAAGKNLTIQGTIEPDHPAIPLIRQADELADLASRGMHPRSYKARADKLRAQAEQMLRDDGYTLTDKKAVTVEEMVLREFDESQPRDESGRWTSGGGGVSSAREMEAAEGAAHTALIGAKRDLSKLDPGVREFASKFLQINPTPPPPGNFYAADGESASRVGVPPDAVPPPPGIPQLPNLTGFERAAEESFKQQFESNPDGMAKAYSSIAQSEMEKSIAKAMKGDPPKTPPMSEEEARKLIKPTFETDGAKQLSKLWGGPESKPSDQRAYARGVLNTALHQTANAVVKRAFVAHLDTLKPGDTILVTAGGCGAGKGYALEQTEGELGAVSRQLRSDAAVVWDSAGDQNGTETEWILKEAEKRGLKVSVAYVDADPEVTWADPKRGVVQRANDPKNGRMVDARVFADSYAYGARNFQKFADAHKDNPNVKTVIIRNGAPPKLIPKLEQSAFVSPDKLLSFAQKTVAERTKPWKDSKGNEQKALPSRVVRGAMVHLRTFISKPKKKKGVTVYVEKATMGDEEGAMTTEDTKPKDQAAQSDEDAFTEGMIKWLDREDERSEETTQFVREKGLAVGIDPPESLELDPESGECIVNGIRESEFGKGEDAREDAVEGEAEEDEDDSEDDSEDEDE